VVLLLLALAAKVGAAEPRPAAIILDLKGRVEIRSADGASDSAQVGELLYPDERLGVPAGGFATIAILGAGTRETIKPSCEVIVTPSGCMPLESIAKRMNEPRTVVSVMKGVRGSAGDRRKLGVGYRSGPDDPPAITPIFGATVASERPGFAWPPDAKSRSYRVKLNSSAGRNLWSVESTEPRLAFPEGKQPLKPGYVYRWEVTDQDFRAITAGEFSVATQAEREQFKEFKALTEGGDRSDRFSAVLGYRRIAACAEAIAVLERLAAESPDVAAYRDQLAELKRLAGLSRKASAEAEVESK
jgi:hypothetical protein